MKMLRISLLLILISCLIGYSETDVQFTFANGQYNISQYTNVTVMLQPEQMNVSGVLPTVQGYISSTNTATLTTVTGLLAGASNGLTTNIQFTDTAVLGGSTNTLYFTNGILRAVTTP